MNTVIKTAIFSFIFIANTVSAQKVMAVYKIDDLLKRIKHPDTTYVVNFWATWCKPCIQELPAFDSLQVLTKNTNTKLILVSLDFKEDKDKKINPFLQKNGIKAECVILDEINGNDFIDKIDKTWTGAIPATLIKKGNKKIFLEKKLHLSEIEDNLKKIKPQN